MGGSTTVIDILAQVTDETESGTRSAVSNITKLEQSMQNLQKQITGMKGKSRLEVQATLKDMASRGIEKVASTGRKIAGKVWTVTLKAKDLVTAPFKKIWSLVSNPMVQAASFAGISFGIGDTINTYKDFEAGMSQVQAISGATGSELEQLTAKAREMGSSTKFTAEESAEAFNYMAMAGWKTGDMLEGIEGILSLAAASGEDLATTSDIVTDALTAFGMQAGDAGHFSDVLAAAASNANTTVSGMGETFKYAGSMAGALGYSIEDVALATGLMANTGIKGTMAGTSLNSIFTRLSTNAGGARKALQKLGIEFYDSTGNARDLSDIMEELRTATADMSAEQKSNLANTIAGTEAQKGLLAILNASEEDYGKLSNAINNADGAAKDMSDTMQDNLQGSLTRLSSAAEGVKISLGEKLEPYVRSLADWVTEHMPEIETTVGGALDFITGKIDDTVDAVHSLTSSPEWEQAETLWDKIKLSWDKLIAEPFDEWWNGTGKTWLSEKANDIGEGIGTALHDGLLAILGIDVGGAATDGADIGRSFADGFLDGFDGAEVGKALAEAIKNGMQFLVSDAATLLPGGEEASSTSGLSATILAYGGLKTAKTGYNIYKGGKTIVDGAKGIGAALGSSGVAEGIQIANAAKNGGTAAQSALAMAENGTLGFTTKVGAKAASGASKVAQVASKAAVPLAAVASVAEMGVDAYKGTKKAEEWTGSDSTWNKIASGAGAALGGTGDGILGEESAGKKALDVAGGAAKGAGIGAAVGSIIPGVGTAIGAGVGAGVGALGAAVGGSNIAKGLSTAGDAIKGFFTETVPEKFGEFTEGAAGFFTETVPESVSSAGEKISGFFTETVPEKWDEFTSGAESFFTEQVPYAIGYAGAKTQTFFTETVPGFFGDLWDGAVGFFTETVPSAVETVGDAVGTFFTETVPGFFGDLWDGAVEFFTEDVPAGLETVGEALTGFFTETVPDFFGDLWDGVVGFFTEVVPSAIDTVGNAISTFFTETIPGFFSDLWDGVVGFFTETVPEAVASTGAKISGSASAGYQAGMAEHAEGGIMTSPHVGLVAEDGAEAIIPLSNKRRDRGISLWEKTGRLLGVKAYADGGIVGILPTEPAPEPVSVPGSEGTVPESAPSGTGINVPVTIENIAFEISVDGSGTDPQELAEAIKENVRGMTDEIAHQLAAAMKQAFANTPKASWSWEG